MGELVVVRHGQTEWSTSGQHTGLTDLPLLAAGEDDARRLRPVLAERPITHAFVSPLTRARRTAELAGLFDDGIETAVDPDLVEVDYGRWEGRTTPEIRAAVGGSWSLWEDGTEPGDTPGETLAQVAERVDRVLARVRPLLADGDVALVAHGHVLRVLTAVWLGLPPQDGALFALPAGRVGVLGFDHEHPALTAWALG